MYERILVPLDGSTTADRGLQEAIKLATLTKARLCLLHVIDIFPAMAGGDTTLSLGDYEGRLHSRGEAVLAKAREVVAAAGVLADSVLREVMQERVADVIAEEAGKGCDLIVMGTHGRRGFARFALGSDAEQVLRGSPVPVLLVREPGAARR